MRIVYEYFRPAEEGIESLTQELVKYDNGHYSIIIHRTDSLSQQLVETCHVAKEHALEVLEATDKDGMFEALISFHRDDFKRLVL